ncbi:MAG: AraC family transcriptional regulator [bacterium]|nr:AraC family transcriptional regulator [bacterium]
MNKRNITKSNRRNITIAKNLPFKLYKAIEYIGKNYMDPDLCLKDVAESVNLHPKSFSFLWNKYLEISIPDFINELRIRNARKLLTKTTDCTSKIAHRVGFNSYHFNRVFKVKIGTSPNQYRNSLPQEFFI